MDRIPLCLVGDGPAEPSGLGRILRDLGVQIVGSDLPVDLCSVGGPPLPYWRLWPAIPMGEAERGQDWGASYVREVWRAQFGDRPGILWIIWDPSRLAYYSDLDLPVQRWSYAAIDGANRLGRIGGPAGQALHHADRVLAYGRYGSTVLGATGLRSAPYLPHGLEPTAAVPASEDDEAWVRTQLGPHCRSKDRVIGCVATNQPRKDLSLFFEALSDLAGRGHKVFGWLHTDTLVKAWAVPQLIEDCGLRKRVMVSTVQYDDRQLACLYQACSVTIAPGLGEGFGYPIVESLANGVPVVHVDAAGGKELVPKAAWRFPMRERRLEGTYAVERPVCRATDVANAIERVWDWQAALGPMAASAYCRGSVAHLDWQSLWPRWRQWIRQGLEGI